MSINLLDIAESTLGSTLLSKASELFGFNQEQGKDALASVLPTLLSGVLNKASTNEGATSLYKAVADSSIDSHIGSNLTGLLSNPSGVSKLGQQGNQILGFLFGDKATGLGEHVASIAGTPAAGTKSLLALAAPAVFGLLKNQIVSNKLSPHGFTSLLSSQAVHLEKSLPEKVLEWLGWGSLASFFSGLSTKFTSSLSGLSNLFDHDDKKTVVNHNSSRNNKKGGGFWKWLLALALLALAIILFKSCQKDDAMAPVAKPAETVKPEATPAAAADSTLNLTFNNGKATVSATVATEADKAELLKNLEATYGKDNVTADIKVDASVKPSGWLAKLADVFNLAKSFPGAELNIKGSDVTFKRRIGRSKIRFS